MDTVNTINKAYVVLDLELRAASTLEEHSPTDVGLLWLFWSVGGGTPGHRPASGHLALGMVCLVFVGVGGAASVE